MHKPYGAPRAHLASRVSLAASLLAFGSLGLSACATAREPAAASPAAAGAGGSSHRDPWEQWNRKVFGFNEQLDAKLLKPVATAYSELVPKPLRLGVDNFFGNINDAWSAVNLFLQGRFEPGVEQTMRVAVNSTLGFVGLLDVSSEAGLERRSEDMGTTFGRWGSGMGPYIVWPLFGPSSLRDTLATPLDWIASPSWVLKEGQSKVAIFTLRSVNTRSNYLRAGEMLDGIALDKYTFIRDAYLTRRGNLERNDDRDEYEVLAPEEQLPASPQAGQ